MDIMAVMAFCAQVRLILWKNVLLRKRSACVTAMEAILPLFFCLLVYCSKMLWTPLESEDTNIYPYDVLKSPNKTILFSPNTVIVKKIMNEVSRDRELKTRGFINYRELLAYYKSSSNTVSMGLDFTFYGFPSDSHVNVTFSNTGRDTSGSAEFLLVQYLLSKALILRWNPSARHFFQDFDVKLQRVVLGIHDSNLSILFGTSLMLSVMLPVMLMTKGIVHDKEKKLKYSMRVMGMSTTAYWFAWFITSFVVYLYIVLIFLLFFCGKLNKKGSVMANTDPCVFVVFLLCYGISSITFACMISVFFQKENLAAVVSGLAFFSCYFPWFNFYKVYEKMTRVEKFTASLFFNMAMQFGFVEIDELEIQGVGAQWSNIRATNIGSFSLLDNMMMMLVDSGIFFIIAWYVGNLRSEESGISNPWYFPFTFSYWFNRPWGSYMENEEDTNDPAYFEKEPAGLTVFKVGSPCPAAVNNLNLNFYNGQITVLLGQNGAGKTTTMSMLTGLFPPTSGTAYVNDHDIRTERNLVYRSLGVCPDHNILFDKLTVREHLEFFAILKGMPRDKVKREANMMAFELRLELKVDALSATLSDSQKRMLAVGISFIGGSKIVILDEPTSVMDPTTRHQTWEFLRRHRHGRTILLTSHFMDEADLLGDRIAIMAKGDIKCCGTPMFLKKQFRAGYFLVVVKNIHCVVNYVTKAIQNIIPAARLESDINVELTYLLPDDQSSKFATLFNVIQHKKQDLGIDSFGASATTMEAVFLKIGMGEKHDGIKQSDMDHVIPAFSRRKKQAAPTKDKFIAFNTTHTKHGLHLQWSRLKALFIKKAIHSARNRHMGFIQNVIPAVYVTSALFLAYLVGKDFVSITRTMDLSRVSRTVIPYTDGLLYSNRTTSLAEHYTRLLPVQHRAVRIDRTVYRNISDYFAKMNDEFNESFVIAAQFETLANGSAYAVGFYNGNKFYSQATSLAYIMNSIVSFVAGAHHTITIIIRSSDKQNSRADVIFYNNTVYFYPIVIMCGMTFLTSSFAYFLIKERMVGAKQLQQLAGVSPLIYWMSNLAWDYISYLVPCFVIVLVHLVHQIFWESALKEKNLIYVFLVYTAYGFATIPLIYILQFFFKSPATGVGCMFLIVICTGITPLIIVWYLERKEHMHMAKVISSFFTVCLPHCSFANALHVIYNSDRYQQHKSQLTAENCGDDCYMFDTDNLMDGTNVAIDLVCMFIQGIVFFGLTLSIEYKLPQKIWHAIVHTDNSDTIADDESLYEDDSDVLEEKKRIKDNDLTDLQKTDMLVLVNLYKKFGKFVAVDRLSIGIPTEECFGLLGQDGAGKSTTVKMLTGEIKLSGGNAYVKQHDIRHNMQKVHEKMGYCPEFDALIDQMTGRETLYMYSRLKGVPEHRLKDYVAQLIDIMGLGSLADTVVSAYSGANKRKLSTSISLVGNPSFILLDEPSKGMDPKDKRQLWNVLSKIRAFGKTLILTSQSMEECDALCTRIAIMVNGQFRCLGSPQHLKSKFQHGYTIILKMATLPDGELVSIRYLAEFIKSKFRYPSLYDDRQGHLHVQVPDPGVHIAHVFNVMETATTEFDVVDYSVHQTTLEQVFLAFAREQTLPRHREARLLWCQCFT